MFRSSSRLGSKLGNRGGNVLEESREDREAADDDAGGNLGQGPEAYSSDIVADIRRAGKSP